VLELNERAQKESSEGELKRRDQKEKSKEEHKGRDKQKVFKMRAATTKQNKIHSNPR
jgi:hypothetical protein